MSRHVFDAKYVHNKMDFIHPKQGFEPKLVTRLPVAFREKLNEVKKNKHQVCEAVALKLA